MRVRHGVVVEMGEQVQRRSCGEEILVRGVPRRRCKFKVKSSAGNSLYKTEVSSAIHSQRQVVVRRVRNEGRSGWRLVLARLPRDTLEIRTRPEESDDVVGRGHKTGEEARPRSLSNVEDVKLYSTNFTVMDDVGRN